MGNKQERRKLTEEVILKPAGQSCLIPPYLRRIKSSEEMITPTMSRLKDLVGKKLSYLGELNEVGIKVIDKAIEVTFMDAIDAGAENEAVELMT